MMITLYAQWYESGYGYIVGVVVVKNENGRTLMNDADMYFSEEKFWRYINKTFIENKRFEWSKPAIYYKGKHQLVVKGKDRKAEENANE